MEDRGTSDLYSHIKDAWVGASFFWLVDGDKIFWIETLGCKSHFLIIFSVVGDGTCHNFLRSHTVVYPSTPEFYIEDTLWREFKKEKGILHVGFLSFNFQLSSILIIEGSTFIFLMLNLILIILFHSCFTDSEILGRMVCVLLGYNTNSFFSFHIWTLCIDGTPTWCCYGIFKLIWSNMLTKNSRTKNILFFIKLFPLN